MEEAGGYVFVRFFGLEDGGHCLRKNGLQVGMIIQVWEDHCDVLPVLSNCNCNYRYSKKKRNRHTNCRLIGLSFSYLMVSSSHLVAAVTMRYYSQVIQFVTFSYPVGGHLPI